MISFSLFGLTPAAAKLSPMRLGWLTVMLTGVGLLTACVQLEPTATPTPSLIPTPAQQSPATTVPTRTPAATPSLVPTPTSALLLTPTPTPSPHPTTLPTRTPTPTPAPTEAASDVIAQAPIRDLVAVVSATLVDTCPLPECINLHWTAPGDDRNMGAPTSYEIRYSTVVITEENWGAATLARHKIPEPPGSREAASVKGLTSGITYYFAVKTSYAAGNVSSVSNVATHVAGPPMPTSMLVPPMRAGSLALIRGFAGLYGEPRQVADASIAVGPRSVIVSTNVGFGIYAKTGEPIAIYRLREFFRGLLDPGRGAIDPRAMFDAPSQRFFLLAHGAPAIRDCVPGTCKNEYLFAVSKSASPGSLDPSDWHRYVFDGTLEGDGPTNWWGDFGTVGTNSTLLVLPVIGTRDHGSPKQGPQYAKLYVFDKRALLRGDKVGAPLAIFSGESEAQRMTKVLAAVTFGDPDTVFAVEAARGGRCSVTVVGISGPPDAPTLLRRTAAASGECDYSPHATQRGGGAPFAAGFVMSSQPVYRDGYIWLVQPVRVSFPSGPTSGVRLVQIDVRHWPDPPRIVYDSTFSEEGVWYLYPALTVSAEGHTAIVMLRVGPNDYASVYYTGRLASDPPGTFRTPAALKLGTANQAFTPVTRESGTYQRFADFSGAALDPSDGTAWVIGEYVDGPCSWGTWVGNIGWAIVDQTTGSMPSLPAPSPPEPTC